MSWSKPWENEDGSGNVHQYTYANIYTKDQIDKLLDEGDWKDAVETFEDINTTYPTPKKGWIVAVNSSKIIYYFDGTVWTAVFGSLLEQAKDYTDNQLLTKANKDPNHIASSYQIEGEETVVYRVKRNDSDNVPYTLLEVAAPVLGDGKDSEATLTLMRERDGESNGVEFLDLYNNGYGDSRQMGFRIQSRGSGQLRNFVYEFNDGTGVKKALTVNQNYIESNNDIIIRKNGNKLLFFRDNLGTNEAQVGYLTGKITVSNLKSEASFEIHDDGYMQLYSPTSGVYMYIEDSLYVNDLPVSLTNSGATRPTTTQVGYCFFDTNLKKPIWWSGAEWVDATGATV